jgi:hypothetical protein
MFRDLCAAMLPFPDRSGCNEAMGSPPPLRDRSGLEGAH